MGKCSLYVLFILLPEGVTLMTMIAMAQEAVPARLPKPYRQPSGPWQPARRHYDRRITYGAAAVVGGACSRAFADRKIGLLARGGASRNPSF